MMEQEQEVELPQPATFNIGDWLDKKHTYPRFATTVYLDREAAAYITQLDEERKKLEKAAQEAQKQSTQVDGFSSIATSTEATSRYTEATAKINKIAEQRKSLLKRMKESSLYVVFSVKDDEIHNRINAEMRKRYKGQLKDDSTNAIFELVREDEDAAATQGYLQLLETIREITNAKGEKADLGALNVGTMKKLMESLNSSDRVKIFRNMNLAITGGNTVDQAIDAGFPG